MSSDTIAVVVAVIGAGVVLAGPTGPSLRELRSDVADRRERMARLAWLFEGLTRREPTTPGTGPA